MRFTFRGGIHVDEHKNTAGVRTEILPAPPEVCISMSQHIGAPAKPIVSVGERVLVGQKIGEVEGLGCPVHSSVSGTVKSIALTFTPSGRKIENIVIENDGENEIHPDVKPLGKKLSECTSEEIIEKIREAGISGMGGAAFPTYAKVSSAIGKADTVIINCAECEPYITANHRLLLEDPMSVINGAKILMKAIGVRRTYIAIEDNKLDAANKLEELVVDSDLFEVKVMKTKYPQGDERQLIYALMGKELPTGKLPADVGAVIFNAETCAAVYNALSTGMPLVRRIVTVDGDCIKRPMNYLVPIGTRISWLVECAGGFNKSPDRMIFGGPMMGQAQWDPEAPVVKSTSALLMLSDEQVCNSIDDPVCIRCGRCVKNCPMHLMPCYIAEASRTHEFDACEKYGAMSCVECGCCSYNCPAKVEIVQSIRVAKAEIRAAKNNK
ncbi:MAG: electron transport complex subunit RsxC [Ruminococcaceae bacterium]|nr:electron transport complex subunit RsxC [Oscillospiraceae bacterium]